MLQPLDQNNFCAELTAEQHPSDTDEDGNLKFDLSCQDTIHGRYLRVQKMGCGIMELSQVTIYPSPGK